MFLKIYYLLVRH